MLDAAERLWSGEARLDAQTWLMFLGLEELREALAFVSSFCNVSAFATDEGLVVPITGAATASAIESWAGPRARAHGRADARRHRSRDEHRLACHLAAWRAPRPTTAAYIESAPRSTGCAPKEETSLMAKGVFRAATDERPDRGFDEDA